MQNVKRLQMQNVKRVQMQNVKGVQMQNVKRVQMHKPLAMRSFGRNYRDLDFINPRIWIS